MKMHHAVPRSACVLLLSSVISACSSARVLITPPTSSTTVTPVRPPDPRDDGKPCNVRIGEDDQLVEGIDDDELDPCSCYPSLPSACTRLLRAYDGIVSGVVVPASQARGELKLEDCGARVGDVTIPPDSCSGGYYGCDSATLTPEYVFEHGLPARGSNWDLLNHAEQKGGSAFRGTTKLVTFPNGGGAAAWADEGGWVYEVTCVPSWDVNKHLQGRRLVADIAVGRQRFGGNLVIGEHEHAIPSRVPPEHVKRCGCVVSSAAGVLFVPRSSWVDNPGWDPCFCRYSLSECDDALPCH